ncbi:MAG: carotenoid biosynthesis protein, partial [Caulobacterales bacterium]|nr:carotenoid biosynthesis protein [Caulobacterales bacterium]
MGTPAHGREKTVGSGLAVAGTALVVLTVITFVLSSLYGGYVLSLGARLLLVAFAIGHGALRYGWGRILFLFALTFVVSWSYETASIMTGFPFGHYHYTDRFSGPWLGPVPLMIMPAYFSMGYFAWTIATIL